jgi:small subunit ribosomal protein S1
MVVECNPSTQKLSLSVKEMVRRSQQSEIAKYIHEDNANDTYSLAEMMRYKDEDKEKEDN